MIGLPPCNEGSVKSGADPCWISALWTEREAARWRNLKGQSEGAGWTIETANDDEPGRSSNLGDVAGQDRHGEDQDRRSEDRARRYEHRDTRRRALGTTAHRQTDPHGDDQDDQEEDNRDHRQLPCHDPNVTPLRSVS